MDRGFGSAVMYPETGNQLLRLLQLNTVENSRNGNPMHRHETSGLFSSKRPPNFHDFQGETQGRGLGEPKTGTSPTGAQGEPKAPQGEAPGELWSVWEEILTTRIGNATRIGNTYYQNRTYLLPE